MKSTRRELLKNAALGGTMLAGLNLAACSKKDASTATPDVAEPQETAQAAAEYVTADNTTAKALGYVEDASTLGADARPDKGATKGADQLCQNCQFFTAEDSTNGVGGKCSLFPGKLVKTQGWCRSWSIKAQG